MRKRSEYKMARSGAYKFWKGVLGRRKQREWEETVFENITENIPEYLNLQI